MNILKAAALFAHVFFANASGMILYDFTWFQKHIYFKVLQDEYHSEIIFSNKFFF